MNKIGDLYYSLPLKARKPFRILCHFLKKKKCYNEYFSFLFAYKFEKRQAKEGYIDALWRIPGSIIDYSFCWEESPQGHSFWSTLNYEFKEFYPSNDSIFLNDDRPQYI